MSAYEELLTILGEVADLGHAAALLNWDESTYMPPAGAEARAEQTATLTRLAHERATSTALGELLAKLEDTLVREYPESLEAAVVRVARRNYDRDVKVPSAFAAELSLQASRTFQAWLEARKEERFTPYQQPLTRMLELQRQKADYLGWQKEPYDALLDIFEPGVTTETVSALFAELERAIVPMVATIRSRLDQVDDSCLHQHFDEDVQWAFGLDVVRALGYDFTRGRQDRSEHPFTTAFSSHDVRITTRVVPDFLNSALFASIHEAGHGLYEQGIPEAWRRHSLGEAASFSLHESQSRLWENVVGRSRPFWQHFYPRLQAAFPTQLGRVPLETFYRAINRVEPSLIRVEADEVTYNLHIFLRFELERQLLGGQLAVADLPEAWRDGMRRLLGVEPSTDKLGVLQDVHWSQGLFGYFPSYTMGNVLSVQLFEAAVNDVPDLPDALAQGSFQDLLGWMRAHIHEHGSRFTGQELVHRATGRSLDAQPYLRYLQAKYREIYGF